MKTIIILVLTSLFIACGGSPSETNQRNWREVNADQVTIQVPDANGKILTFSGPDSIKLVDDLLAAVDPSKPENEYMPPFMKTKLKTFYTGRANGQILFQPHPYYGMGKDGKPLKGTLMSSNYLSGADGQLKPTIHLYVPRLLSWIRVDYGLQEGFSEMMKNTFALCLVHEMIHLEQPAEFLNDPATDGQDEMRAWYITDIQAVRELRKQKVPMEADWLECDDILLKCKDYQHCPEFVNFLTGPKLRA